MKDSEYTNVKTTAKGIFEAIRTIGQIAEYNMENAESEEEWAFLFGHVNMAAALLSAMQNADGPIVKCEISMDYEHACKAYKAAKELFEDDDDEDAPHQISMEELFPELFKTIKQIVKEASQESKPKKTTPKKPSNKKE